MLALKAENISKQYRIGQIGTGTLSHDLNRAWHKLRRKDDPYLKVGEVNDNRNTSNNKYLWALKDINFEIEQGDVVGIIGKNGAGKSTLLKILSKVTSPTTGKIYTKGRISSLLEVGTGFHPEMTGRENLFLNGAILGMTKKEIKSKFDEIVDFADIEKYIDTPVKRYSSGMYVRLAFAVAAHLDSEILIVDEVLAVGDAEFQKKCLGKMGDISKGEGRTVLFVSHNMAAVQNLCNNGILLHKGGISYFGEISKTINHYLRTTISQNISLKNIENRKGNGMAQFIDGKIEGTSTENKLIETFSDMQIILKLNKKINLSKSNVRIDIGINDSFGSRLAWLSTTNSPIAENKFSDEVVFTVKNIPLAPGEYNCNLYCEIGKEIADWLVDVLHFTVIEKDYYNTGQLTPPNQGFILLQYYIK